MVCPAFQARLVKNPPECFKLKCSCFEEHSSATSFLLGRIHQLRAAASLPWHKLLGLKGFNLWYKAWGITEEGRQFCASYLCWFCTYETHHTTMRKAELYCNQTLMGLMERLQDCILWLKSVRCQDRWSQQILLSSKNLVNPLWKILSSDSWTNSGFLFYQHTESQNGFVWKRP